VIAGEPGQIQLHLRQRDVTQTHLRHGTKVNWGNSEIRVTR
jgi:hypothetical protein